jgi:hypothetical protein
MLAIPQSWPDDLPLPLRAFVVWLVLCMWKRDFDAAAGS